MCDYVTTSSSTFHYCNNTTINHDDNHVDIDYHDDNGHHNCHNNFIMTKKRAARMKTGPNNASGIVWALVSFIFSPFILFDAHKCFIISTGCIYNIHEKGVGWKTRNNENGPKQCVSHRLGPR